MAHSESFPRIGAFYDLYFHLRPVVTHPLGKVFAAVTTIGPKFARSSEPSTHLLENFLAAFALRTTGRRNKHSEYQTQRVYQDVSLASLDVLAGVEPNLASVRVRLDALTVHNCSARLRIAPFVAANADAERVVQGSPSVIQSPCPKDMVDGFPRREIFGQQAPGDSILEQLAAQVHEARTLRHQAAKEAEGLLTSHRRQIFGEAPKENWIPLSDYVQRIVNGKSPATEVGQPLMTNGAC